MVCSKCHQDGHNARTCSSASPVASSPSYPVSPASSASPPVVSPIPIPVKDSSTAWTSEEDASILHHLQDPATIWNDPTALHIHNQQFHKQRTELNYRQRVKKIAQENNIPLKTNNRWTEEEKTAVIEAVRSQPINTPWEDISLSTQRSELAIKSIYHEHVTPVEHINHCLQVLQPSDILQMMDTMGFSCISCTTKEFSQPFIWQNNTYCEICYTEQYKTTVEERWRQTQEYAIQTKKTSCNLCNRLATFDQAMPIRFHYDHLDMFNKSESVCEMVRTGAPMDDIYREMDKCQLLCISCHRIVTKMEHLCGFVRLKKQMEDTEEKRQEYSELYRRLMTPIYEAIKNQKTLPVPVPVPVPVPLVPSLSQLYDDDTLCQTLPYE